MRQHSTTGHSTGEQGTEGERATQQHRTGRRQQETHNTTPQGAHGTKQNDEQHHAATRHSKTHTARGNKTKHGARSYRTPRQRTAPQDTTLRAAAPNRAKRNNTAHNNATPGGTRRSNTAQHSNQGHATASHRDTTPGATRTHQETTEDSQAQQRTHKHNRQQHKTPASPARAKEHLTESKDAGTPAQHRTGRAQKQKRPGTGPEPRTNGEQQETSATSKEKKKRRQGTTARHHKAAERHRTQHRGAGHHTEDAERRPDQTRAPRPTHTTKRQRRATRATSRPLTKGSDTRNQQHQPPETAQTMRTAQQKGTSTAQHSAAQGGDDREHTARHPTTHTADAQRQETNNGHRQRRKQTAEHDSTPPHDSTAQQNTTQGSGTPRHTTRTTGRRATWPDKDSTTEARHQDPPGDSRGQPGPTSNTAQHQPAHGEQRQGQHHRGTRGHTRRPKTHKPAPHRTTGKKKKNGKRKNKEQRKKKGGGGAEAPGDRKAGDARDNKGGGGQKEKKKGGGDKTPRPKAPGAGKHAKQDTTMAQRGGGRGKGIPKRKNQQLPQTGQPQPGGGLTSKERTKNGQKKGEAHQTAPGRPACPTRPSRARTRTHARDPGVASSDPKGAVSASTRESPGAPAEFPCRKTDGTANRTRQ